MPDTPPIARYAPARPSPPPVPEEELIDASEVDAITLEQLLVYADERSPLILAARARGELSRADVIDAEIALPANPVVSFGVGSRAAAGGMGFDLDVSLQQQVEVGGERDLRRDFARNRRQLAEAQLNEVRWGVHVEVHRLFVSLLLVRERFEQAERFGLFSQKMRSIAKRQAEAGESSPLIMLVADADLARTKAAKIEAQRLEASLTARLCAVIGWEGEILPRVEGELPEVRDVSNSAVLLERMAKHHPSLRTRELALLASRSNLALQEREAWPEPTFGISYGTESSPVSEERAHVVMLGVSIPLSIWRQNQGERARALAELSLADRERTANVAKLRGEILQATASLSSAVAQITLYEEQVIPKIEKNLTLLQRSYELGEIDVYQVSQMRERLLNTLGEYIDARVEYYEAVAILEGLVGAEVWPKEVSK